MKKITLSLFLFLTLVFPLFSQVQVGSGTNTSQNLPLNPANNYSYSQSIYLASEIKASGKIKSIQWYYNGNSNLINSQSLVIYLGTTDKNSFASANDWVPFVRLTQVYAGGIDIYSSPGWKTLTFTTEFDYNGVDNLVVATDENSSAFDIGVNKFWNTQTESNRSIVYSSTQTNPDPSAPPASGATIANYVPNIILGDLSTTCPCPYNFIVSDVLSSSATLSWQASVPVPLKGSDYYYSTTPTRPTDSTPPLGSILSGTSATLSELAADTLYYVWVRNKCGDSNYGAWSELTSFRTTCVPIDAFSEGFELPTTVPNLPTCWTSIVRGAISGGASVTTKASNPYTGVNSVVLFNGTSSGSYEVILVSPKLATLSSGACRLKFYAKGGTGINFDVVTLNSNRSDAVYTVYEPNIATTSTMEPHEVDFSFYRGEDTFIGFRLKVSAQLKSLYLDDIQWEYIPLCVDATNITVPAVTSKGATVEWNKNASELSWDVAIGTSNVNKPDDAQHNYTTVNPTYTTDELDESTHYKVWVRSVCTEGNGSWIGPVSFTTDCAAIPTFIQTFDGVTSPALPACWTKIVRGDEVSASADVKTVKNYNNVTAPNSLVLLNAGSTGVYDIIAVSPNLSTLSEGKYRLRFKAKGIGALDIGTLSTNTKYAEFHGLETVATTDTYKEFKYEFKVAFTDSHVGIRLSTLNQHTQIFIDNIVWELIPLCPDVEEVTVSDMTPSTATITWKDPATGSGDSWDIAVGASTVSDPSTITEIKNTLIKGSFAKDELHSNTSYNVWVRSNCGSNKGAWIGPVTFITPCEDTTQFGETFNETPVSELPDCWTKIMQGSTLGTDAYVNTDAAGQYNFATNSVTLFSGNSAGETYDIILVSPPVSNLDLGTYRLRFKVKGKGSPKLQIGTLDTNAYPANFTEVEAIDVTSTEQEYKIDFAAAEGTTDRFVGLRLKSLTGYKTIYIDDVYWEPKPLCTDVEHIAVAEAASDYALLSWSLVDNAGEPEKWNVAVGPVTATDPETQPKYDTDTTSIVVLDLSPATIYKVWVRSDCGDLKGDWIGPVQFNTDCLPVEIFGEGFNITPFPLLPVCWNKIIRNAKPNATITNSLDSPLAAHSKPGHVTLYGGSPAVGDVILVGPRISTLNDAANYQLSFYATGSNLLEVGTLDVITDSAVFTKVAEVNVYGINGNDNKELHTVDMSTAKQTDNYIGFRLKPGDGTQNSDQYISMDDIIWEPKLGKNKYDFSQLNYYPNPVEDQLFLSHNEPITSVIVYNLLGQEVLQKSIHENVAKIDMSNLTKGPYIVKVIFEDAVQSIKIIKD